MSLNVAAVPPSWIVASSSGVPLSASIAAILMGSTRASASGEVGSPRWATSNRTVLPSGEKKLSIARLKSSFSNTSGGR